MIRVMKPQDYDSLYDMWIHCSGMGLNDIDDSREGIEKYLKRNPTTCFVAMEGDKLVGAIMAGHDGRRGQIHHTSVLPEYRGKGIASELVSQMEKAMKAEGINKIFLVAFARNELGNSFWEGRGYSLREDLSYRNKALTKHIRRDS